MEGEPGGAERAPGVPILAGGFQLGSFRWTGVPGLAGPDLLSVILPSTVARLEDNWGVAASGAFRAVSGLEKGFLLA